MRYLKTYKIFESIETYQDLLGMYMDCFIDLFDMNVFVGVDRHGMLKDINDELIPYTRKSFNEIDDQITIEIRGSVNGKENSSEHLTKFYNEYLVNQLQEDEYQFEKLSGYQIHNGLIKIDIKEWDVYPTTERWDELVNDKNLQNSSHGGRVQYNKDEEGRGYAWYTYVVNSDRLKKLNPLLDDRNFIQRLFSKKKRGYNFPKLNSKMEVRNFQITHYISDK